MTSGLTRSCCRKHTRFLHHPFKSTAKPALKPTFTEVPFYPFPPLQRPFPQSWVTALDIGWWWWQEGCSSAREWLLPPSPKRSTTCTSPSGSSRVSVSPWLGTQIVFLLFPFFFFSFQGNYVWDQWFLSQVIWVPGKNTFSGSKHPELCKGKTVHWTQSWRCLRRHWQWLIYTCVCMPSLQILNFVWSPAHIKSLHWPDRMTLAYNLSTWGWGADRESVSVGPAWATGLKRIETFISNTNIT